MKIAIIGIDVKLPNNINSIDDIYNKLNSKIDCIDDIPCDRFNIDKYYDIKNNIGKMKIKQGGYLNNIYDFDNDYFKIGIKEAKTTDPQQRLLLMSVYNSMIDSKMKISDYNNTNTGVFIGSCGFEYFANNMEDPVYCNEYSVTGGLMTLLSNRISYIYNLKGPSMTIDTACSSSGNALHMAVESIKRGESEMCIVGGSNLLINPETTVGFSQGQFLSPDCRCKTFDNSANGYVRSEGIVTMIIKPLDKAIDDNNHIYAIINNTASNQDGKTKSITMPNCKMQEKLLQTCYQNINYNDITFIEAHGTGTKLGDKIEANSIGNIIGKNKKDKLNIGSFKSVIGHTEAISGLASIAKIITMMKYRQLLPNLNFNEPSENIDFDKLNINVITETTDITTDKIIMGVNNYGFGGSNFHCVLENYIAENNKNEINQSNKNNLHLLALYGNSEEAIDKNLFKFLEYDEDEFMKYLYNANKLEKQDEAKLFIVKDKDDLENIIFNPEEENKKQELRCVYGKFATSNPKICLVFGGQGSQYERMGLELMKDFPVFKNTIIKCDNFWNEIAGFSFIEKYGVFTDKLKNEEIFNDPLIAQPSILFYQIAMVELLKYFNVPFHTVVGHSAGELGAFYASGAINLKDIITVAHIRSTSQQKTAGGGNMLVINDSIDCIDDYIDTGIELAVINSSNCFVVAGKREKLLELSEKIKSKNKSCIMIKGRCAFHSSGQDNIKEEILQKTKNIRFNEPTVELVSTVTGFNFDKTDYSSEYWWKNIRQSVLFKDTIDYNCDVDIFIEVSPHPVLSFYIKYENKSALVLSTSNRKENSSRVFLSNLAKLYFSGVDIKLDNFGIVNNEFIHRHQWNCKKFIHRPLSSINRKMGIDKKINQIVIELDSEPYLREHIIGNNAIIPTVKYLDIIIKNILRENECIENFKINKMLKINSKDTIITLDVIIEDNIYYFIYDNFKYVEFCITKNKNMGKLKDFIDIDMIDRIIENGIKKTKQQNISVLNNKGFNFGDNMYRFKNSYTKGNIIITEYDNNLYHPTMIDIMLTNSMMRQGLSNNFLYIPEKINRLSYNEKIKSEKIMILNVNKHIDNNKGIDDFSIIFNENKEIILVVDNIFFTNVDNKINNIYNVIKIDKDEDKSDYQIIENKNLLEIRNILLKNLQKKYLIIIKEDYEKIGFIRTLLNEIKEPKFKICYGINLDSKIKYNINFSDLENFYDSNNYTMKIDNIDMDKIKIKEKYSNIDSNIDNYYLHYTTKGNINNLKFKMVKTEELKEGQLKIKITDCSINFKDIAVILGIVDDNNIGYENSGIVIESKSNNFNVGDKVFIMANGKGFTKYLVTNEKFVWKSPDNFDNTMSSSFGLSYGTAYLALIYFGNINKNMTVMIHNASGALGLACLEICRYIGCKVIATCSTEVKRNYLLENYDNIVLVTNSRDYNEYYSDVMKYTSNIGVDIVLGSSYDKFIETNLDLLKHGGKYLDVGKRQLIENKPIISKYFLKSISYIGVHFDRLLETNNQLIRDCVDNIIRLFNEDKLRLFKYNDYNMEEYMDVFKEFSKSKHIGKIVLKWNDFKPNKFIDPDKFLDSNMYYLITGGFGGIGVKFIDYIVKNGARKIILTSRKDKTEELNKLKEEYKDVVFIIIVDDLMDRMILESKLKDYDIDGVFHMAGCIKDMMADKITQQDLDDVVMVKKQGIINLGSIFENKNLTYFVAFSSIVSIIGNIGQANYAAANSFMDYYCKYNNKINCLSINLGAIGGCGMIENDFKLADIMLKKGIDMLHYYELFESIKKVLLYNKYNDNKYKNVLITNQDFNKMRYLNNTTIFDNYITKENNNNKDINNISLLLEEKIKQLLELDEIDKHKNLLSYGVDSIMSMQIANFCMNELKINIKQVDILQGMSVNDILSTDQDIKIIQENENNSDKFYYVAKNEVNNLDLTNFVTEQEQDKNKFIKIIICIFILLLSFYYIFF